MVLEIPTGDDKSLHIGAMVDVAREVIELSARDIQNAPEVEDLKASAPITGIVNNHGDITMIMDITKVFSLQEVKQLNTSIN